MTDEVRRVASTLAQLGYHVIPVNYGKKFPEDKNFLDFRIHADEVPQYFDLGRDWNLGLLLGTEVTSGAFLAGIDVDVEDELLISRIRAAIPGEPVAKRGKKGITFLVRTAHAMKSAKFARKDPITKKRFTVIDFMGVGNQTVLPPSVHPDGPTYTWTSQSTLENTNPLDLPVIDEWCVHEIRLAVEKPDSPWFLINDMSWNGPGGGGTVDDSLLRATGAMVEAGAPDDFVYERCRRAVDACLVTHGNRGWDDRVHDRRIRSMVEDARKKGFEQSIKINPALARAEWLAAVLGGLGHLRRLPGSVLRYQDGCWTPQRLEPLETRLISEFRIPHKDMREALLTFRAMIDVWPDVRTPKVRLQNGTYDLMSGTFMEAGSPEDYILYRLPFSFDPEAICPIYDSFIRRTFKQARGEEDERTDDDMADDVEASVSCFEEFAGLTLVPDISYQTALVVIGETRTGKSTLINLIQMLHSPDAVSSSTIDTLNEERSRTAMVGKLVNISPEASMSAGMADRMFKAITGGDRVPVRELYKEQTYAVITARIIIVGNENFHYNDSSGATERRLLYLHCGESLAEQEQDPLLPDKLAKELPGVFNRLATAYLRLRSRGRFDKPGIHRIKINALSEDNNQVYQFLIDQTHEGLKMKHAEYEVPNGVTGHYLGSLDVYARYMEWAKASGHKAMSNVTFGTRLTRLGFPSTLKWIGKRPLKVRALSFLNDHKNY